MHRLLILLSLLVVLLWNASPVLAQQGKSGCVVTKVGDAQGDPTLPPGCGPAGGIVYYCQGDPQWNGSNYSDFGDGNTCIMQAGCGPTSLAMIVSTFGVQMTPIDVDKVFQINHWRNGCGEGSVYGAAVASSWFKELGFSVGPSLAEGPSADFALMKQAIDEGNLIYAGLQNYPCLGCINAGTPVGHVIVIDDVDVEGKRIHTRDPNNCDFATGVERLDRAWVRMSASSPSGPDTSQFSAENASWTGAFPIKKI